MVSANPLFDDEGNVRGSVGAHIDVTERKQMERTLRERAELLELASEAIIVCNNQWTIRFWNSGAEAVYGWKREEAIGQNIRELLKTSWPIPVEQVEAALATHGRWDGNIIHRTKDGREIVVASRQAAKRDGDHGVLEINRDITAQHYAEEALRKTERLAAMGRVAGIIAHEINNPLEAITNTFYLLRDHPSLTRKRDITLNWANRSFKESRTSRDRHSASTANRSGRFQFRFLRSWMTYLNCRRGNCRSMA